MRKYSTVLPSGKRGRFTILTRTRTTGKHRREIECRCECGTIKFVRCDALRADKIKSCGCYAREETVKRFTKHGDSPAGNRATEYHSWTGMLTRCSCPTDRHFKEYGGRGIKVCERWSDYKNFIADMGRKPSKSHTIDRKNNDGNYCPENCRWATKREQGNNRRTNKLVTFNGQTKTCADWAREVGLPKAIVVTRLNRGWTVEQTLTLKKHSVLRYL